MARHVVAPVGEIPPGGRKAIEIGDRRIVVFNLGGEFFALSDRCPHQGGSLCQGLLSGHVESPTPGEYIYARQGEMIRCPWHYWEFDIRTGKSWFDPRRVQVRRAPTRPRPSPSGSRIATSSSRPERPRELALSAVSR